jgi:hypothetical protein
VPDQSGSTDAAAARDMGAFELTPHKPHTKASSSPSRRRQGRPFQFSARASSDPDPGDSLRCVWHFDDRHIARGTVVTHSFSQFGRRRAKVTVTDLAGLRATDTPTVKVTARHRSAQH